MSEAEQVADIMQNLSTTRLADAKLGKVCKLVGRVVTAGTNPFPAPADGSPCVYYQVIVQQEEMHTRRVTTRTNNGSRTRMESYRVWVTIINHKQMVDFFIQDGDKKVLVNEKSNVKIESGLDTCLNFSTFATPSWGIQSLMNTFGTQSYMSSALSRATGNFRYSQRTFAINEVLSAIGLLQESRAKDPYGNTLLGTLVPCTKKMIDDTWGKDTEHKGVRKLRDYVDVGNNGPVILLSDNIRSHEDAQVPPIAIPEALAVALTAPPPAYNPYQGQTSTFVPGSPAFPVAQPMARAKTNQVAPS